MIEVPTPNAFSSDDRMRDSGQSAARRSRQGASGTRNALALQEETMLKKRTMTAVGALLAVNLVLALGHWAAVDSRAAQSGERHCYAASNEEGGCDIWCGTGLNECGDIKQCPTRCQLQ